MLIPKVVSLSKSSLLEELLWSGEWSSPSKSSFGEWRSLRFEAFEEEAVKQKELKHHVFKMLFQKHLFI
jgi:hypothetical protein